MDIKTSVYDKVTVISIDGDIYLELIERLDKVWKEVLGSKPSAIAFDSSKIKYLDSSAIGAMVKYLNQANQEKIELIFFDLSEAVVMVFNTARLGTFFKTMERSTFEEKYLK